MKNAHHANQKAQDLTHIFRKHNIKIAYSVESNEVFVNLTRECAQYLQNKGVGFYSWGPSSLNLYRFVTSWMTSAKSLENLDVCLSEYFKDEKHS